jgi:hypothetical protein
MAQAVVVGFSKRSPGYDARLVDEGFVVDRAA